MFGKSKKRIALIKELAEFRLESRGTSTVDIRLYIKSLGSFKVMSLPEATIVVIIEIICTGQSRGIPLIATLDKIERQRKSSGHDPQHYKNIQDKARGENPAEALPQYLHYRNCLEAPMNGRLTYQEISEMVAIAYMQIRTW